RMLHRRTALAGTLAVAGVAGLLTTNAPALAGSGGVGTPAPPPPTVAGHKAKLVNGLAVAPKAAPQVVKNVIAAANKIAKGHGYCLGGGYAHWQSPCYDCSSSVSFALHGGGLINHPMSPTYLERWGRAQRGKWITVHANSG